MMDVSLEGLVHPFPELDFCPLTEFSEMKRLVSGLSSDPCGYVSKVSGGTEFQWFSDRPKDSLSKVNAKIDRQPVEYTPVPFSAFPP